MLIFLEPTAKLWMIGLKRYGSVLCAPGRFHPDLYNTLWLNSCHVLRAGDISVKQRESNWNWPLRHRWKIISCLGLKSMLYLLVCLLCFHLCICPLCYLLICLTTKLSDTSCTDCMYKLYQLYTTLIAAYHMVDAVCAEIWTYMWIHFKVRVCTRAHIWRCACYLEALCLYEPRFSRNDNEPISSC